MRNVLNQEKNYLLELQKKFKYIVIEITNGPIINILRSNLYDTLEIIDTLLGEKETYSHYQEIFWK